MNKEIKNTMLLFVIFFLKNIKLSFPLIFIYIFIFNKYKYFGFIVSILYFLIIIIHSFFKWNNIIFTINKKYITYKSGFYFKKIVKIPLNKLTVINIQQNLIQKFFNIYSFKLYNSNITSNKPKIIMLLKNDMILNLKILIKNYKNNFCTNKSKLIFKITIKNLIIFAITENNIIFGIGIIFTIKNFLEKLSKYLNYDIIKIINPMINFKAIYMNYKKSIINIILITLIIFFILSTLISIIQKCIKFYNFRIYKEEKNIIIKYGLILKKNYIIPIENIIGINLKQNFIKQIFNLYKLKILTIGYGQEKQQQAILYPIANHIDTIKIIEELLPNFNNEDKIIKPPQKAFLKFFVLPSSIFLFIYLIITILNNKFKIAIFLFPILIFSRYLNYKNIGLKFNKEFFWGINKGFYKNILILKTCEIQLIEKTSTYFQRKKELCTYKIYYPNGNIKLQNLDEKIFKNIKNII